MLKNNNIKTYCAFTLKYGAVDAEHAPQSHDLVVSGCGFISAAAVYKFMRK